jgi:hypothetical protein
MAHSYRPENDVERDRILGFAATVHDRAALHRVVVAQLEADFEPCAARFVAARLANAGAATTATLASATARTLDVAFDAAFGRWVRSVDYVRDEKVVAAALRDDLGRKTPSDFVKDAPRTKVSRMVEVLEHVRVDVSLTGDPARLDALRTATDALADALATLDGALAARATAVKDLHAAELQFDGAWGLLVAAVLRHEPALGALLPTFARTPRTRKAGPEALESGGLPPEGSGALQVVRDDAQPVAAGVLTAEQPRAAVVVALAPCDRERAVDARQAGAAGIVGVARGALAGGALRLGDVPELRRDPAVRAVLAVAPAVGRALRRPRPARAPRHQAPPDQPHVPSCSACRVPARSLHPPGTEDLRFLLRDRVMRDEGPARASPGVRCSRSPLRPSLGPARSPSRSPSGSPPRPAPKNPTRRPSARSRCLAASMGWSSGGSSSRR